MRDDEFVNRWHKAQVILYKYPCLTFIYLPLIVESGFEKWDPPPHLVVLGTVPFRRETNRSGHTQNHFSHGTNPESVEGIGGRSILSISLN